MDEKKDLEAVGMDEYTRLIKIERKETLQMLQYILSGGQSLHPSKALCVIRAESLKQLSGYCLTFPQPLMNFENRLLEEDQSFYP